MNKKHIATLIAFLSLTLGLSLRSQTILNGRVDEIRAKIEAYDKEKATPTKRTAQKRKKQSTKAKFKKLRHISDSIAIADYMIQLDNVNIFASRGWPQFPIYSSFKEAKKAFQEPQFTSSYYRTKHNIRDRFRQPHDILSYQGIDEWGYYTVRFLVDQEGLILMAKAVTNLSPDIDEEMERCILGLPQLTPATFGEKKYPATGTLVIEYEIEKLDEETKEKYLKKNIRLGNEHYYLKLSEFHISWMPAITPLL